MQFSTPSLQSAYVFPFKDADQSLTFYIYKVTSAITSLAFNEPWQSILSNGTVNKPANNFLTGTTYGAF